MAASQFPHPKNVVISSPRRVNRPFNGEMSEARFSLLFLPFVVGIPFVAFSILALRHFYILGGFWGDSGVIAFILWRSDLLLHTPLVAGGASFFATHVSPIFIPLSMLSRVLPLTKVQFFAAFTGACYMLPAVAVYWLFVSSYRLRSIFGAAILSLLFAFNGIALAAARNPHFEMLIIGSGMIFLVAFVQRKFWLATLSFAICLATREDAGFDLFALFAVTVGLSCWRAVPLRQQKPLILYGILALAYSTAAIILQRKFFPGGGAFSRVYLGAPAFHGITWQHIADRLGFYMAYRLYIFMPGFVALAWAIRLRNPYIVAGYFAFIPWGILQLLAASPIASTLSNYYSFPFIFALFWPVIGLLIEQRLTGRAMDTRVKPILGFTLMLLASFMDLSVQHNPGHLNFPVSFFFAPSLVQQKTTGAAVQNFVKSRLVFGHLAVDGSIAALDPDHYDESELVSSVQIQPPNSIIFFAHGYEAPLALAVAAQDGLQQLYQIPGTPLRVATDRPLNGVFGLVPVRPVAQK
jgi:hypothetical protein